MVLKNVSRIWKSEQMKQKILLTLGLVLVYKFLSVLTVPGVNLAALENLRLYLADNQGLSFFSALMGGGLEQFSLILMGLSPYINASIILQLLAVIIPQLETLKKEGEQGQKKINMYTRWLTIPLAFAQSYGMILLFNTLASTGKMNLINANDFVGTILPAMLFITAGTVFLMWLGELINDAGIGNGISIIIFAGVLSGVPAHVMSYISAENYTLLAFLVFMTLAAIYIIIRFTEGYRKIPLIYTRTGREEKSYFPIRINQAGMIPIIFALSLITFPSLIGQLLQLKGSGRAYEIGVFLASNFNMSNPSWMYIIIYFLLVLGFSFFYISIAFNTTEIAENIQKRGGYIPGFRPGKETAQHLEEVSNHLNLYGGGFLAFIAVFPYLLAKLNEYTGIIDVTGSQSTGHIDFLISGSGLIIVVGVVLDLIRRVDSELKSYDYKKFSS